jgi:dipeptidyl-peptidase-3
LLQPRLAASQFELIVHSAGNAVANQLWDKCKVKVYSLEPSERELGLPPAGVSSYYSENITKADIELVQEVLNENKIEAYNTRLFKVPARYQRFDPTQPKSNALLQVDAGLEVRLASAQTGHIATYEKRGVKVNIIRGDFLAEMSQVVAYLEEAKKYAANEHQANMITSYVRHFQTGEISTFGMDFRIKQSRSYHVSLDDHKDAQRHWIRDNGPVVETNIGFIESYRDPFGS